ncbi:LPXTG-motif cell wall anchor domain-containing protein [Micromonospora purpureochromogenes]|uniref:LPXTG-motif cell wall anchor domain-containing protein n=1 Tax=Micromonospora purpureochromogenes TaxID=47872 RepID=A0A1C4UJ69_9ACTN|nr:LPXTG cell wall anchor domain-containing protein [Micromonospora purpureochromogenes]SCE71692.1 LPXTG-motif cell wall anchor domain-containing protein [Micromonospora purpureochromogenes]
MLTHSTRRWLAGLGVAGAFVAASATPAFADEKPKLSVYFGDTTVALGSPGTTNAAIVYSSAPVILNNLTVRYDYRDLLGKATFTGEKDSSTDCASPEEGVLVCTDPFEVGVEDEWGLGGIADVVIAATDTAKEGDTGAVKVSLSADGYDAVQWEAEVRVGEGVDIAASEGVEVSGAPGASFTAPLQVSNAGETSVKGLGAIFFNDHAIRSATRYSNCTYDADRLRSCQFDQELAPGSSYEATLSYQIGKDAFAPGFAYGEISWQTTAELEDFKSYLTSHGYELGKPGDGPVLTLQTARALRGVQADTNPENNWSSLALKVTGKNGADLAAVGDSVQGEAGDLVHATIGVKNNGPAALDFSRGGSPVTKIDVTVPAGTTAVEVPEVCVPFDGERGDWENAGKAGAKAYRCWPDVFIGLDEEQTVEFGLRIDKVVPNAAGTVTINAKCECEGGLDADLNKANDTAKLLVNATGGNGGGGDGGTLPITGESTALVAGIGGLLLAAGVGGYVVARRRKTRFVA